MREGPPVQQPVKPVPSKAFHEVEGRPTWKPTMPATAPAFLRRGRSSPRLADQYEDASMRAVGRFLANSLGYVASEHDYIGARPFALEESESAKGPFKPQGAPSGKSLGRSREDRHRRTSVRADKKQKKGRLDADPTN